MMIQVEIRIKSAETQESPVIEHGSCGCARVGVMIAYKGASYCRDVQFYDLYGKINANCEIIFFLLARPRAVKRTFYLLSLPFFPMRCCRD
jgi:hypothetical protein